MSQADTWYVRLPDGRTFWAASTTIVRQHLQAGRIPPASLVRRSPQEEWVGLPWTEEFADLANVRVPNGAAAKTAPRDQAIPKSTVPAPRLDPQQRKTPGIRSLLQELVAALDHALVRRKLLIASIASGFGALLLALARVGPPDSEAIPLPLWWCGAGVALGILAALGSALLTRMTSIELSRLRPARWPETVAGLGRLVSRLFCAHLLIPGLVLLAIGCLRRLPLWMQEVREEFALPAGAAALVVEVVLWPVLAFGLLLAPILVVEECSVAAGLTQWWQLLRQQFRRIFLYEGLALVLGGALTLACGFPVLLAALGVPWHEPLNAPLTWTLWVLGGLATGPFLAYLVVANVFIYLNLRYEYASGR